MAVAQANLHEPVGEINTTPLIDVMLVLLVMFVITIPVATNSLDIDLPQDCLGCHANAVSNKVTIDPSGQVSWNGEAVSDARLSALLQLTRSMAVEPELQFAPDPLAAYDRTAHVMQLIKASGVTNFGFVGNYAYRHYETLQ